MALQGARQLLPRLPVRRGLSDLAITTEAWHALWQRDDGDTIFSGYLQRNEVEEAWTCPTWQRKPWGPTAPDPLGARRLPRPVPRLFRQKRLLSELLVSGHKHDMNQRQRLAAKVRGAAAEFGLDGGEMIDILHQALDAAATEAEEHSRQRLRNWKEQVQFDFCKASRWVNPAAPPTPAQLDAFHVAPLCQGQAGRAAQGMGSLLGAWSGPGQANSFPGPLAQGLLCQAGALPRPGPEFDAEPVRVRRGLLQGCPFRTL